MLTNEEIQLRLDKLADEYICTLRKPDGSAVTVHKCDTTQDAFILLFMQVKTFAENVGKSPFAVIDLLDDAFEKQRGAQ